jgi:hypothetical protein
MILLCNILIAEISLNGVFIGTCIGSCIFKTGLSLGNISSLYSSLVQLSAINKTLGSTNGIMA